MDQLKTFLRQCVKYRFWIVVGVAMILPMAGYFAGASAYTTATAARENEIKSSSTDVGKYTSANPPNVDYKRIVDEKKEVLSKDVDSTQRKLYALQEPLLRWPAVVESKFRTWGRKWPENVDRGQVQEAINDYTNAYPGFVTQVYQTLKPWNPEDGAGVVYAPDEASLIKPAQFKLEVPPELGVVWAEQERLWVITALLDVIAKVNKDAGAKDWDGAWVKQVVEVNAGSMLAQDQMSLAKGVVLEAAPPLIAEGAPVPDPATEPGADPMMTGMGGGAAKPGEVFFLKSETAVPYKILPVQLTVLIEQARLPEFLVALENSPMAIQVMEPEISKPTTPVIKPVYNESGYAAGGSMGMGMGMGMGYGRGMGMEGGGPGMMGTGMMGRNFGMSNPGMMEGMRPGMGAMSGVGQQRSGTDLRSVNKAAERKQQKKKDETKAKTATKKGVDQYFNIVQLTVYGQARFYNTPAPIPPADPSTAPEAAPAPDPTDPPAGATPAVSGEMSSPK